MTEIDATQERNAYICSHNKPNRQNMDGIMTWMKENYDLLTLLVAVVGVVVSCIAVVYETRKKKQSKKKQ